MTQKFKASFRNENVNSIARKSHTSTTAPYLAVRFWTLETGEGDSSVYFCTSKTGTSPRLDLDIDTFEQQYCYNTTNEPCVRICGSHVHNARVPLCSMAPLRDREGFEMLGVGNN